MSDYNKAAILEWRERVGNKEANKISRLASSRGTRVHSLCENYLKNNLPELKIKSLMPDVKQMFSSIRPIMDERVTTVYALSRPSTLMNFSWPAGLMQLQNGMAQHPL